MDNYMDHLLVLDESQIGAAKGVARAHYDVRQNAAFKKDYPKGVFHRDSVADQKKRYGDHAIQNNLKLLKNSPKVYTNPEHIGAVDRYTSYIERKGIK